MSIYILELFLCIKSAYSTSFLTDVHNLVKGRDYRSVSYFKSPRFISVNENILSKQTESILKHRHCAFQPFRRSQKDEIYKIMNLEIELFYRNRWRLSDLRPPGMFRDTNLGCQLRFYVLK